MILKDLEQLLASPMTLKSTKEFEFDTFAEVPKTFHSQVVTNIQVENGRLVLTLREPQSTKALEAHGYQFETGF